MPRFNVVRVLPDGTASLYPDDILPYEFMSGGEAEGYCRQLSRGTGHKFQPRPIADDSWEQRERARYASGEYQPLPWVGQHWYKPVLGHYAHVSKGSPGKIAYTENPTKGASDTKTVVSPGKYLKTFFGNVLSDGAIKTLATQFAAAYGPVELKLATTAAEIVKVYRNGPSSCMSHAAGHFNMLTHPVTAYAGPDLAVGYIRATPRGKVQARALCWPEKKIYGRVYGDSIRLNSAFKAEGYTPGSLRGARMAKIPYAHYTDTYLCPYIDLERIVHVTDRHLVIGPSLDGRHENLIAYRQDGRVSPMPLFCVQCGNPAKKFVLEIAAGQVYCDKCAKNLHRCQASGWYSARRANMVPMSDGTEWHRMWFQLYGFACTKCGKNHPNTELQTDKTGKPVCYECHFGQKQPKQQKLL